MSQSKPVSQPLASEGPEPEQRIAEIAGRLVGLAEEPWRVVRGSDELPDDENRTSVASSGDFYVCEIATLIAGDSDGRGHATFIAEARDDIPWLLGIVSQLRADLAAARSLLRRSDEYLDHGLCRLSDGYGDPCTCGLETLRAEIAAESTPSDSPSRAAHATPDKS